MRNIFKKDFVKLFRENQIQNRTVRINGNPGEDRYKPIRRIITEELESQNYLSNSAFDDFIFDQLFYSVNNWQYVYKNHDIASILDEGTQVEICDFLDNINGLKFNTPLVYNLDEGKYTLCTTRAEFSNQKLSKLHFLIKVGRSKDQDETVYLFSGITLDLESSIVIIRFSQHLLDNYEDDAMDVLKDIKDMLNGANRYGRIFEELNLNVIGLNDDLPKKIISSLFKEVSAEAEEILNRQVPENTEEDIRTFLEGKGLPSKEDYVQQIKSVIFQDISAECADTMFPNGWVFRFIFREGLYTRASSRTDDRSPIYGSKVYWHLKELIFNSEQMQESGIHWYLEDPATTENPSFVQVRFESRSESLLIHYYYKMRNDRKEKEEYVLQKIKQHF